MKFLTIFRQYVTDIQTNSSMKSQYAILKPTDVRLLVLKVRKLATNQEVPYLDQVQS